MYCFNYVYQGLCLPREWILLLLLLLLFYYYNCKINSENLKKEESVYHIYIW